MAHGDHANPHDSASARRTHSAHPEIPGRACCELGAARCVHCPLTTGRGSGTADSMQFIYYLNQV